MNFKSIAPAALIAALSLSACSDSPLAPTDVAANSAAARGTSSTQTSTSTTARIRVFADLTAPSGGAYPAAKGKASWDSRENNTKRELELEVEHLPAGLAVEFFMDGAKLGGATTDSFGKAQVEFSTQLGQSVPMSVAGSKVEVRTAAGAVIVSGGFATP